MPQCQTGGYWWQQPYIPEFKESRREWFSHTRFCRRQNAPLALDIPFSTSFGDVRSFVMMLPRYVNFCTTLVDVHQCGYWELRTETSVWLVDYFCLLNKCSQLHVLNCIFSLTYDIRVIQIHPLLFDHRMNIEATWGPKYSFERTRLSASLTRGCMKNISH